MPAFTEFNSDGLASGGDDPHYTIVAGTAGETPGSVELLAKNFSGSVMDAVINFSNGGAVIIRSSGARESMTSGVPYRLNADESINIEFRQDTVTQAAALRFVSFQTHHGLSIKPGTGHTAATTQLAAGVYVGTVNTTAAA